MGTGYVAGITWYLLLKSVDIFLKQKLNKLRCITDNHYLTTKSQTVPLAQVTLLTNEQNITESFSLHLKQEESNEMQIWVGRLTEWNIFCKHLVSYLNYLPVHLSEILSLTFLRIWNNPLLQSIHEMLLRYMLFLHDY